MEVLTTFANNVNIWKFYAQDLEKQVTERLDSLAARLGLQWEEIEKRPVNGKELLSKKLAEDLMSKTAFKLDEWKKFGIKELTGAHFIKSAHKYFKPRP
eukprot:2706925-Prymnesium_polylepis.1